MRLFMTVWKSITWICTAIVIILLILFVGVRLVGLRPFIVLSGSMEPKYSIGSLLYVKNVEPEDIKVGDVITYIMNEQLDICTHRVVDISEDSSLFYTKGDANNTADQTPVHYKNLIGIPVFAVPMLGYIASAVQAPAGLITVIVVMLVLIVMSFVPDLVWGDRRRPMTKYERRKYNRR